MPGAGGWDGESLFHGGGVSVEEEVDSGDGHTAMDLMPLAWTHTSEQIEW